MRIHLKEQRSQEYLPELVGRAEWQWRRSIPVILKDDGIYDASLDRFLLDLPANGAGSRHTLRSYGYDLIVWLRFLQGARSRTVWEADSSDVTAFHKARRQADSPVRICGRSWNRCIAALDKLYKWGVDEGLISRSPFSFRKTWTRSYGGRKQMAVDSNTAYERGAHRSEVRFLMLEDFHKFRDLGLESWSGRTDAQECTRPKRNPKLVVRRASSGNRRTATGGMFSTNNGDSRRYRAGSE